MIFITCFIHLMYWEGVSSGIFENKWVSVILIEMPIIFYIAGASYSLSVKKPYLEYVWSRIKRVAFPYWKYALFCLPIVLAFYWEQGRTFSLNDLLLYFFFTPLSVPRIFSHIWFILPYLCIGLCLPPLVGCIRRYGIPFVFFGAVLVLLQLFRSYYSELLQTVIVYMFFTIWGLYYKKELGWQNVLCIFVAMGYLIYAFAIEKVPFDMQANKFPPDLLFASYGMAVLGIGGIYMKKGLISFYNKFAVVRHYIDIYSKEGYEIYLIHPFTTLLLAGFKWILGLNQIIAKHWYLQVIYVIVGFLFLLCVNVYVLRAYNYIWSLVNRTFKAVFPSLPS